MGDFDSGEAEFVAGTFKSIRVFEVGYIERRIALFPVTQQKVIYTKPNHWYEAVCARGMVLDLKKIEDIVRKRTGGVYTGQLEINRPYAILSYRLYGRRRWSFDAYGSRISDQQDVLGVGTIPVLLDEIVRKDPHPSPDLSCACGFYSFYNPFDLRKSDETYWRHGPFPYVMAVVENAGKVLHGTLGLRSSKMRILGVAPVFRSFNLMQIRLFKAHEAIPDKFYSTYVEKIYQLIRWDEVIGELTPSFPTFNLVSELLRSYGPLDVF